MTLHTEDWENLRGRLCELQRFMLERIMAERARHGDGQLAAVSAETAADTIYAIDKLADAAILEWFAREWPIQWPVEIIMEGLEDGGELCFPRGSTPAETVLKCILDPIDGTRGIMYDKRSAWMLAGLAPQRGADNTLVDIRVAAMTELPTTRAWRADQISAVRGQGIHTLTFDLRNAMKPMACELQPSQAREVRHAFGTITRFFPAGLTLLGELEERFWQDAYGTPEGPSPLVFNDQYISTGGQFYELLSGHDRFIADLRPLAFRKLGIECNLACHPYDVATALLLEEAGCIIEKPEGGGLDCPLDTTTPVSWVAYANSELAEALRPSLRKSIAQTVGRM